MRDDLSFAIAAAPTVSAEDLPILTMRLGWLGEASAYVPIRFAVAPLGDVRLKVTEGGRELGFAKRIRLAPARASDFLAVEPGDVVVAGFPLAEGYALERGRTYEITAELVCPEPPPELAGYQVVSGRCEARPVRLTLR